MKDPRDDEEQPDALPDALGAYTVLEKLGQGGMGEVFLVHDPELDREVAAKVAPPGADRRLLEGFVREARLTGRLDHPHIVPVHDLGTDARGRLFFTMKRVRGRTLEAVIAAGDTSLVELLEIFAKVCEAVAFAHDHGVLHRDLKPANVMVGAFGEVLVLDWGLGRQLGEDAPPEPPPGLEEQLPALGATDRLALETRPGTIVGTPAYMAPEQARGATDLDARADVYGLGAVLYQLLCGEAPYRGPASEVLAKVLRGARPSPRERAPGRTIPWELEQVVEQALARRREDRYASAGALLEDIRRFLEGRLLGAARYHPLQRFGKWVHRHRVALSLGAALCAVLIFAGLMGWRERDERRRFDDYAQRGRAALAAGQPDSALPLLERALALRADSALVRALEQGRTTLARRDERRRRELEEVERQARLAAALEPLERGLRAVLPLFSIAHLDIRGALRELSRSREAAAALAEHPDFAREVALFAALGRCALLRGALDEAVALLERAHALAPADLRLRWELARACLAQARFGEWVAVTPLLRGQPQTGARSWRARAEALLAGPEAFALDGSGPLWHELAGVERWVAQGRYEDALARAADVIEQFAAELGVDGAWLARGELLARMGELREAESALSQALRMRPHHPQASWLRAGVRRARHRIPRALEDLDAALVVWPEAGPMLCERGCLRWLNEERQGALADFGRATAAGAALRARLERAEVLAIDGENERAVADYTAALALAPDSLQLGIRQARAMPLTAMGRAEEALDELLACAAEEPLAGPEVALLIDNLAALGRLPEAEEVARDAVEREITDADLVAKTMARAYDDAGEAEAAARWRAALSARYETEAAYWLEQALHLEAGGDLAGAVAALDEAIARGPTARMYFTRANTYGRLGQHARAIDDFRAGLALEPDNARAHQFLGLLLNLEGRFDEAVRALEASLLHDLESAPTHSLLGKAHVGLGAYAEAVQAFEAAAGLEPAVWENWHNLIVCLGEAGRWDDAADALQEARARSRPEDPAQLRALEDFVRQGGE